MHTDTFDTQETGRDCQTRVVFAGAGPGAADLITLRARRALDEADLVLYAGSLVNQALLEGCKPSCRLADSSHLALADQVRLMAEAAREGRKVVRLHSGDPSLYGAIREQMQALADLGIDSVVIPGVTSALAAAAALGCELTLPGTSQSVIFTRSRGRTPLPEGQAPAAFARTGGTLVFYLSAGHFAELARELQDEGGLAPDTPCAVVSRASWEDERILRGRLADIADRAREAGIHRQALLLAGPAIAPLVPERSSVEAGCGQDPTPDSARASVEGNTGKDSAPATSAADIRDAARARSLLYDASFSHGYRNSLADEAFDGPVAVLAFSDRAGAKAEQICQGLGDQATLLPRHTPLKAAWSRYRGLVCLGATGLVVRLAAPLLRDKASDPALVCVDEAGRFAMSLVSGHLGGANRLARRVARVLGCQAVVSTATDCRGLVAFDEAAAREGARVLDTRAILACNRALLEGRPVDFDGPADIYTRYWADCPTVRLVGQETGGCTTAAAAGQADPGQVAAGNSAAEEHAADTDPAACARPRVCWDRPAPAIHAPVLAISSRTHVLGAGCHRGLDPDLFCAEALAFLERHHLHPSRLALVASLESRGREPAMQALAARLGVPFAGFAANELARVPGVVTTSAVVERHMGTPSVSEAAALAAAAGLGAHPSLAVPRESARSAMTFALARIGHNAPQRQKPVPGAETTAITEENCESGYTAARTAPTVPATPAAPAAPAVPAAPTAPDSPAAPQAAAPGADRSGERAGREGGTGRLVVAGLGSGQAGSLTREVWQALTEAEVIAGYTTYTAMVRPLLAAAGLTPDYVESGMRSEIERCREALARAAAGKKVCLVCSGDPGLLAMAGLVLELKVTDRNFAHVPVRILPGVTSALLAAARLGAPLQNGAVLLSLSDLLVPAEEVRRNLRAASTSALPVALYNPAGRRRRELLHEALQIFAGARGGDVPCALVRHAGQPQEWVWTGPLKELPEHEVDMASLVFLGSARTRLEQGVLFEPRGYADKYGAGLEGSGRRVRHREAGPEGREGPGGQDGDGSDSL